ncbi:quaternary ammonium compound efflux SMR transporter SugE [Gilvimarinus sp. F26214L]|uniref:quaternary ammonium compound efflux SMR transporter SugE n=1 Tax=Gilvimarinus sp. DZF01 TaxID=3461371 RepID=UPI004045A675
MNWVILVLAGLLEVVWAVGLKYTQGFTKVGASVFTVVAMIGSFYLLSLAMRTLPLGTAYGVWVGIGAVGAALAGIVLFREPVTVLRLVSLLLVVAGIVGLRISTPAD